MKQSIKKIPAAFLFAMVLVGYPISAGLTSFYSIEQNVLSLIYRVMVLVCALGLLIKSFFIARPKVTQGGLIGLLFLSYYVIRMFLEWLFNPEGSKIIWNEFWIFLTMVCLIPALPFAWRRNLPNEKLTINLIMILGVIGLTLNFFSAFRIDVTNASDLLFGTRLSTERLNPIAYGHLAVTTVLIAIWSIISTKKLTNIAVLALICGLLGVVASGSRGPVLSFVVCLIIMFINLNSKTFGLFISAGILVIFGLILYFFTNLNEVYLFNRIAESMFEDESRNDIQLNALSAFFNNVIIGAGYPFETYPHNIILEAFMSSGIVGGLLITAVLLIGLVSAIKNLRASTNPWMSIIFIQYLLFSMVSNSIYYSNILWMLWICVVVASNSNLQANFKWDSNVSKEI